MPAIRPFAALRYDERLVGDLSRVIAPPYDVIGPEEQERLYQASPYNVVRLILGKESSSDTPQDNRYTRARRDFDAWRQEGILRADRPPALYLIEHTFDDRGSTRQRLGFIALLELTDAVEQAVFRHEATLAAPKQDRTKLLEAVPANLEPIFCVYPDEDAAVQTALQEARQGAPIMQASIDGEAVRVWAVTDPRAAQRVTSRLAAVNALIADGHHRFEVACAKRQQYRALMSYFVSMAEPSLVVRPIHRMVAQGRVDLERLRAVCAVEPAPDLASLLGWLESSGGNGAQAGQATATEGCFGFFDGRALYRVRLSPDRMARWLMNPTVPLAIAKLDVSLLHGAILPDLGLTGGVSYTADAPQVVQAVSDARGASAWLLRGIPLAQVYAIAAQGLALPPKSTYFYPKVPSGLTINPLL